MSALARRLSLSLACAVASSVAAGCGTGGASSRGAASDAGGAEGAPAGSSGDAATSSAGDAGSDGGTVDAATAGGMDGASSSDALAAVTQTVSSWLGTNVAADLPRVDVAYQLAPFDTPAAQLDANGYPVAGASGKSSTDIGFVLPSGTYKISYVGTGTLAVSGIGKLGGAWQSAGGEQRNTVVITGTPGSFGNVLTLAITNGAGQSVQQIRVLYPGFDYDTPTTFLPKFIGLLTPFRALRFMDWENTNNSKLTDFASRPNAAHFGHSPNGEPYEHIAELVNETGKDCWITIPEAATDSFVTQFAAFMAANLDMVRIQSARSRAGLASPFQLIVENSNETWNQGFSAYGTFLAAANADGARYTGKYTGTFGPSWMTGNSDLMKVGQYEADRLVKIGDAFRAAFGSNASVVAPVLSGWALGPAFSDDGLQFVQSNYGDPKRYVAYVAQAPYFNTPDDSSTGALSSLFAALDANIAGMDATFKDFSKLVAQYGIPMAAYEGGQSLTGTTNQSIKHLAQHDERMYEAYKQYLALWKQDFGTSLFMHFSLAGDPGQPESVYQYGYWGSIIGVLEDPLVCGASLPTLAGTEMISSAVHHCPKYKALAEHVPE
ncbi:MAG TPA: hypothetical protein VKU41_04220 [Polyangiaceae bacterium]|nr:hypothetical protein [Polyangiaceae bacterium]